jgi:hypothetical protein
LIKELLNIFKYTDYERFKERVIDSIENEQISVVEYGHLIVLDYFLSQDEKQLRYESELTLKEIHEHMKSFEFRERLVVDYINVLKGQKESLELRKIQLLESFSEFSEQLDKDGRLNRNENLIQFKLRDFISKEAFQSLVDLVKSETNSEHQWNTFSHMVESIDKYMENIKRKTSLGCDLFNRIKNRKVRN